MFSSFFSELSSLPINVIYTLGYLLGAIIILLLAKKTIHTVVMSVDDGDDTIDSSLEQRARTLGGLTRNIIKIVVWGVVVTMILSQWGVNIAPILTGAGVLGLAVGFGAQTLVKDIVTGFFILFENQYNVGDKIEVAAVAGEVLTINLRTTVLKSDDGKIHIIPNSKIDKISKHIQPNP